MKKNLIFFNPSKKIGGAEWLFIRIIEKVLQFGFNVYIIDYEDGFIKSKLSKKNIIFIAYDYKKRGNLPEDSIFIAPLSHLNQMVSSFNFTNQHIVLWSLHPKNIEYLFPSKTRFLRNEFNNVKIFFEKTHQKHCLWFMDQPNLTAFEQFLSIKIHQPIILPIPIDVKTPKREYFNEKKDIRLCWIGRIAEDKFFALLRVLEDANLWSCDSKQRLVFSIIGDGNKLNVLKEMTSTMKYIECQFFGSLDNDSLHHFLTHKTDAVFAMGTSLLEAGQYAIPTILSDPADFRLDSGLPYPYLFELSNSSLGRVIYKNTLPSVGYSFNQIMLDLYDESKKRELGELCRQYVIKNHEIKQVIKKFMILLENTESNSNEINMLNAPIIKYIWKIRNTIKLMVRGYI